MTIEFAMQANNFNTCANCVCTKLGDSSLAARLLGLCPLLAVSTTLVKALAICLLLFFVALTSTIIGGLLRSTVYWRLKPVYFATIASAATVLVVNTASIFFPALIESLGIYALLIAVNCLVIANLQEITEHAPLKFAVREIFYDSVWITCCVMLIAGVRELGGVGRLFHDIALLANQSVTEIGGGWLPFFNDPAGALIVLALLLAVLKKYQLKSQQPTVNDSVQNTIAGESNG